jgi:hypothetical protein
MNINIMKMFKLYMLEINIDKVNNYIVEMKTENKR